MALKSFGSCKVLVFREETKFVIPEDCLKLDKFREEFRFGHMKTILRLLLSIAVVSLTISFAAAQIPTNGLIAYYPFQGNVSDASGNERNGVATAITYDTDIAGRPASSAVFVNGSAVDIPSLTGFQFRPITYSLWVYFSNIQSDRETTLIGRKRAYAQSDGGVTVETRWAVNNELSYSTGGTIITSGFALDIGKWYHIVFTQDAQTEASFYVNGELLSSQPFTAVQDTDTFPFRLGAESALAGISTGEGIFNGKMDNVRIYDRALSSTEVTDLYNAERVVYEVTLTLKSSTNMTDWIPVLTNIVETYNPQEFYKNDISVRIKAP